MIALQKLIISLIVLFIVLITGCGNGSVSTLRITAQLDTTEATIGDIVHLQVVAEGSANRNLEFPDFMQEGEFEIRKKQLLLFNSGDKGVEFQIVFWDTGKIQIPGYPVTILKPDSSLDYSIITDSFFVTVHSTIPAGQSPELRPIKDPVPVSTPFPWRVIILTVVLLLLMSAIVYIWKQRIKSERNEIGASKKSFPAADQYALERLGEIDKQGIGNIKIFYVQLSHIIREYVENSLFIKTLEMTTEEIQIDRHLRSKFEENVFNKWLDLLNRADLVKFAKQVVPPEVCRSDLEWAKYFILSTADGFLRQNIKINTLPEIDG